MSKHQNKNKIIDERLMQELREREWQKELLAAKNRHKCKYYVALEIGFFLFLIYALNKSILAYYNFKTHQQLGFWDVFFGKNYRFIMLRCLPLGLGTIQIIYFIFSKMGVFKYREKAERYRCPFFYYSYREYLYERIIWMENTTGFFMGAILISVQFAVDFFFPFKDGFWPLIIFFILMVIMPYLWFYFFSSQDDVEFPSKGMNDTYPPDEATTGFDEGNDDIFH